MPSKRALLLSTRVLRVALVFALGLVFFLGLIVDPAEAGEPFPLGDLFTEEDQGDSDPDTFATLNGVTFFKAKHPTQGVELWRTDGTPEGTWLFLDINPGSASSSPFWLTRFGDWLYFSATDHSFGRELWRTDGTVAGTEIVADIQPGPRGSFPAQLTVLGGELIFSATTDETGSELWKLTTNSPAEMIADLYPGTPYSSPGDLLAVGDSYVVFSVNAEGDNELGITDGTEAGTLVFDINPDGDSSAEPLAVGSDGLVYFQAFTPERGLEIWTLAPSSGEFRLISDANPGSGSSAPAYPIARGVDLFVTLSTPEGRKLFMSRAGASVTEVAAFDARGSALLGTHIFFFANDALWRTDGVELRRLAITTIPFFRVNGQITYFTPLEDRIYFFGDGGLWSSDGTDGGTGLISPVSWTALSTLQAANNQLYASPDGLFVDIEPWIYDGSSLSLLKDLYREPTDSDPYDFTVAGDRLYFSAYVDDAGREPIFWDGGEAGAELVENLRTGIVSSFPERLTAAGDRIYFRADVDSLGKELVMVEDPADGTVVIDIEPGSADSEAYPFAPKGSELYFVSDDSAGVPQLWATLSGIPGQLSFFSGLQGVERFESPVLLDGALFFAASSLETGKELWFTDGTSVLLTADLRPGPSSSLPADLLESDGSLYWSARNDANITQLWRLNGGISAIAEGGIPYLGLGSSLLFSQLGDPLGRELWSTDGSAEGAVRLADIWPGAPNGLTDLFPPFGAANGELAFFSAADPIAGEELWITDGTPFGTSRLRDMVPGTASFAPREFVALPNGDVAFTAYTPESGWELWRSDGTVPGTYLWSEIVPGPGSSEPEELTVFRDWVVFSAHSEGAGREPWAVDWRESPYLFGDDFESGDLSAWGVP